MVAGCQVDFWHVLNESFLEETLSQKRMEPTISGWCPQEMVSVEWLEGEAIDSVSLRPMLDPNLGQKTNSCRRKAEWI